MADERRSSPAQPTSVTARSWDAGAPQQPDIHPHVITDPVRAEVVFPKELPQELPEAAPPLRWSKFRRREVEDFRATGESLEAIEQVCAITGRDDRAEVIVDAVRVYEWLLYHQASGRRILSATGVRKQAIELPSYVKDLRVARAYFESLGDRPTRLPRPQTYWATQRLVLAVASIPAFLVLLGVLLSLLPRPTAELFRIALGALFIR